MYRELEGRTALVTGASSGLGVDFARELARRGAAVVLVARREERLEDLARELRSDHRVDAHVIASDLAAPGAAAALRACTDEQGLDIDILVNNAGFGIHGPDREIPWQRVEMLLDLDIKALVQLTRLYSEGMVERGWGRILQVASIGAYQPSPLYAAYCAAKAFVLHYGEALHHELRGTGVTCTTVSPGVTRTEFLEVAGQSRHTLYQRLAMMESPAVARVGIRAMLRGKGNVVPGFFNKISAWSMRFVPRAWAPALAGMMVKLD